MSVFQRFKNGAAIDVVEALEELNARRLAAARRADQRHRFARIHANSQRVECARVGPRRVRELDALEFDATGYAPHLLGLSAFRVQLDSWLLFHVPRSSKLWNKSTYIEKHKREMDCA